MPLSPQRHNLVVLHYNDPLVVLPYARLVGHAIEVVDDELDVVAPGLVGVRVTSAETRIHLRDVVLTADIENVDVDLALEAGLPHKPLDQLEEHRVLEGDGLVGLAGTHLELFLVKMETTLPLTMST